MPISAILLLAMAVIACWGKTTPLTTPPTLSPAPTMTSTPTLQPTPSPTDIMGTPTIPPPSPETPRPSSGSIEERAREALADWLGISSEEIEVVEVEEVEWPDTSLGCPQPGMAYVEVIVPGCCITLEVAGETYEAHTGGERMVLCDEEGNPLLSQ